MTTAIGGARAVESGDSDRYLNELVLAARQRHLANTRDWGVLLHLTRSWGGTHSEADGVGFFLSPAGKQDASAELEADLESFFQPAVEETETRQHPQCAFPARYRWLRDQLDFDPVRLPEQPCPRFEAWRHAINASGATLIFASSYLNNPASMFGHTFLRFDRRGQPAGSPLLSYVVNYSADPGNPNALLYAVLGLTGGFKGYFTALPYYLKVREYNSMENRDLWEYKLNLSQGQVDLMVAHAWELGTTYFDYFYIAENCSYHVLSLLEVALASADLRGRFWSVTVPVDTLRAVDAVPGLVAEVVFRPSLLTRMSVLLRNMNAQELELARSIADEEDEARFAGLEAFDRAARQSILGAAGLRLRYQNGYGLTDKEEARLARLEHALAVRRSRLGLADPIPPVPLPARPEQGHSPSSIRVGALLSPGEWAEILRWRPVLHDLLDDQDGFARGTQIEMLSLGLRFYPAKGQIAPDTTDFIRIVSLAPLARWTSKPSWRLSFSMDTARELGCRGWSCSFAGLSGGPGVAVSSELLGKGTAYVFGDVDLAAGRVFRAGVRVAAGASAGLMLEPAPWVRLMAETSYLFPFLGDHRTGSRDFEETVGIGWTLVRDIELRFSGVHRGANVKELSALVGWYF